MTHATTDRTPAFRDVWSEQLRAVRLSVRRESLLALTALLLFCIVGVALARVGPLVVMTDGEMSDFVFDPGEPGWGLVVVFTALIFPLVVWKGERPWGDSPLWTLPVEHRRHALTKVAAGWVWLMALIVTALLCVVVAVLIGGGTLGAEEVRQLVLDDAFFAGEPGAAREVAWTTPWWEWVQPFTSASAAYLLMSALLLVTPHPLRWGVAIYLLSLVPLLTVELFDLAWLRAALEQFAWFIGGEDFAREVRLPTGEWRVGWWRLPSMGLWLIWAGSCVGLGLAAVLGGSARARDH